MGPRIRPGTRLWLGGLAAGGVVAAHLLAFLIVAPDPLLREELLETTGHGAWPMVVSVAMGAIVIGLAGFIAGPRPGRSQPRAFPLHIASRLLLLQIGGFILLEGLERLAMGKGMAAVGALASEPVIVIGVVAQVITALVAALFLMLLDRVIVTLVDVLRSSPRPPRALPSWVVVGRPGPLRMVAAGPGKPRGPPRRI
jgi:hypothetical protein